MNDESDNERIRKKKFKNSGNLDDRVSISLGESESG